MLPSREPTTTFLSLDTDDAIVKGMWKVVSLAVIWVRIVDRLWSMLLLL